MCFVTTDRFISLCLVVLVRMTYLVIPDTTISVFLCFKTGCLNVLYCVQSDAH